MANTRNGNTFYIDTQYVGASDDLAVKNIIVLSVTVCATAANAILTLADAATGSPNKHQFRVAASGDSQQFDFSQAPILFPNGVRALTLTNAVASLVVREMRS